MDAAIDLIGEVGVESATLTEVALRADCAIGSVYQYFSGKDELLDAVAERIGTRFLIVRSRILKNASAASLANFVPTVIRPIVQFWSEYPAAVDLLDRIRAKMRSPQRAIEGGLDGLLIAENPALSKPQRSLIARTAVELLKAALHALARTSTQQRRALLGEFELAIQAYLTAAVQR